MRTAAGMTQAEPAGVLGVSQAGRPPFACWLVAEVPDAGPAEIENAPAEVAW